MNVESTSGTARSIQGKSDKLDLKKIKNSFSVNDLIKWTKARLKSRKKLFTNYIPKKKRTSIKNSQKSTVWKNKGNFKKSTNNPIRKLYTHTHTRTHTHTNTHRHFIEEDIELVNKHLKRCSTLLVIRKMQIETTMRYHYTPIKMAF